MDIRDTRTRICLPSDSSVVQSNRVTCFGITLSEPHHFDVGGTVKGSVLIALNSFILIRRIIVSVECHMIVSETEEELQPVTALLDSVTISPRKHRRLFSENSIPFGDEMDFVYQVDDDTFVLHSGNYEYFFEISIPKDCPPSVSDQPHFSIAYVCSASIQCGVMCTKIVECQKIIRVVQEIDLKVLKNSFLKQPSEIIQVFRISEYFPEETNNSGNVYVNVSLNRSWISKEHSLKLSGFIYNNSQLLVPSVDAIITIFVQNDSFTPWHAPSQSSETEKQSVCELDPDNVFVESTVASWSLGSIGISDVLELKEFSVPLPPEHTVISTGRWMSRTFKCSYKFVLKIALAGTGNLHVISAAIPLIVGDVFSGNTGADSDDDDVFEQRNQLK